MPEIPVQSWTVPGKLMIAGEYAVVQPGGHSLAVATGALVRATLRPGPGQVVLSAFAQVWNITAQGPNSGLAAFVASSLAIAEQRWNIHLSEQLLLEVFGDRGGLKLGLGTSAAVTVATLQGAARSANVRPDIAEIADLSRLVHATVQSPPGSGYDVTTIAWGGCVAYRKDAATTSRLRWPNGIFAAALYSGHAASTALALQAHPLTEEQLAAIDRAARALCEAWPTATAKAVLEALSACQNAFDQSSLAAVAGANPGVVAARNCIRAQGGTFRSSGAAGGDCVLAFADNALTIHKITKSWQEQGGLVVAEFPRDLAGAME